MKFVNLTSHTIHELVSGLEVPTSGAVARAETVETVVVAYGKIQIKKTIYGEIVGLPEPQEGKTFIVSSVVLNAIIDSGNKRADCVSPGKVIRVGGAPTGCIGFRING